MESQTSAGIEGIKPGGAVSYIRYGGGIQGDFAAVDQEGTPPAGQSGGESVF
jgi:hypothetical protein